MFKQKKIFCMDLSACHAHCSSSKIEYFIQCMLRFQYLSILRKTQLLALTLALKILITQLEVLKYEHCVPKLLNLSIAC